MKLRGSRPQSLREVRRVGEHSLWRTIANAPSGAMREVLRRFVKQCLRRLASYQTYNTRATLTFPPPEPPLHLAGHLVLSVSPQLHSEPWSFPHVGGRAWRLSAAGAAAAARSHAARDDVRGHERGEEQQDGVHVRVALRSHKQHLQKASAEAAPHLP